MGRVFVSVTISLDGFIAPEQRPDDPDLQQWMAQWMELQRWAFAQRFFRENLKLGGGGETGTDNDIATATFERTGATIIGKRMFDAGEHGWPEEAPFHTPVYVLTHQVREPWERPGGTIFHFVNDGIGTALERAREAAGDRDIRIGGGADVIRQYLASGLVDEINLAQAPTLLGTGTPLFEGLDAQRIGLGIARVVPSPLVTHLTYTVTGRDRGG